MGGLWMSRDDLDALKTLTPKQRNAVQLGIELITHRHLLSQLRADGVTMMTRTKVTTVEPGLVHFERTDDGSVGSLEVDRVALAVGWRPRGGLLAEGVRGPEVVVFGDAARAGDFVSAISEGANAGLAV